MSTLFWQIHWTVSLNYLMCNAQSEQLIFSNNLDNVNDWYVSSDPTRTAPEWLSGSNTYCTELGGSNCVLLTAGSYIWNKVSLAGYTNGRIVFDSREYDLESNVGDECYMEYKGTSSDWIYTRIAEEGAGLQLNLEYILPSTFDDDAYFEIRFGNSGDSTKGGDHCYMDNLKIYGVPFSCSYYAPCPGSACLFPFEYGAATYNDCAYAPVKNLDTYWCAYDSVFQDPRWENCCCYTAAPSQSPSASPSNVPTPPSNPPSSSPSSNPTSSPSDQPSTSPSEFPSDSPTQSPTQSPTVLTAIPSTSPTNSPSDHPSETPSASPTGIPITRTVVDEESIEVVDESSGSLSNLFGLDRVGVTIAICVLILICTCCAMLVYIFAKLQSSPQGNEKEHVQIKEKKLSEANTNTTYTTEMTRVHSETMTTDQTDVIHITCTQNKSSPYSTPTRLPQQFPSTPVSPPPEVQIVHNARPRPVPPMSVRNPTQKTSLNVHEVVNFFADDDDDDEDDESVEDDDRKEQLENMDDPGVGSASSVREVSFIVGQGHSLEYVAGLKVYDEYDFNARKSNASQLILEEGEFVVDAESELNHVTDTRGMTKTETRAYRD